MRDTLKDDKDILPEIGDVVLYDNEYFMVDIVRENEYFAGKNPSTWDGGIEQGYSVRQESRHAVIQQPEGPYCWAKASRLGAHPYESCFLRLNPEDS